VSEPTVRLTPQEHVARLSRLAEEVRAQLTAHAASRRRAGETLPAGVEEGVKHLCGSLQVLAESVESMDQERRNLRALADVAKVVNSSLDLPTVLNEVIDTVIRLTGAERAFLMLQVEGGGLETVVARNWERATLGEAEVEISRTVIDRALLEGRAVLTTNAQNDPRFDAQTSIVAYNLRSILCVPLKARGEAVGVIYADNRVREGLFTERDRLLVNSLADQAAVALENARLFDSVRNSLDDATQLKNLMEDVFTSIASGVLTADIEDRITLCNPAAQQILGMKADRLLGASLGDLVPQLGEGLPERVREAKSTDQRHIGLEVRSEHAGREPMDLALNITPLKMADRTTRGVAIVLEDLTEKRKLEGQRRLFERMVSPAVINQLDPDSLHLGGRRADITTLFADIRGFSLFSATNNPEVLVRVLNLYLAAAAEAVLREEGTIDKFLGDGLMAWFNAPMPQPDHTLRALRAALGIRQAVQEVQAKLPRQFHLSFGVGMHYGEAILGLVGTQNRLDYTAIGDSVNTAKRLQEHASEGQILLTQAVASRVRGQAGLLPKGGLQIKGREDPVEVFELRGLTSA